MMRTIAWAVLIAMVALFVGVATLPQVDPQAYENQSRVRRAIKVCWTDQGKKSHEPSHARLVAKVCETMTDDYVAKYGGQP